MLETRLSWLEDMVSRLWGQAMWAFQRFHSHHLPKIPRSDSQVEKAKICATSPAQLASDNSPPIQKIWTNLNKMCSDPHNCRCLLCCISCRQISWKLMGCGYNDITKGGGHQTFKYPTSAILLLGASCLDIGPLFLLCLRLLCQKSTTCHSICAFSALS